MLRGFSVAVSVSSNVCFVLVLILISVFQGWCVCGLGVFCADRTAGCLGSQGGAGRPRAGWGPPVIFIAGRPRAALLFWFFGDFRCGALLFMVVHVVYKYKNR